MNVWTRIALGLLALLVISYREARADVLIAWSAVTTYEDGTAIPVDQLSGLQYALYATPCGSSQAPTRVNLPTLLSATQYSWKQPVGCLTYTVTAILGSTESLPSTPVNLTVNPSPASPRTPGGTALVTTTTVAYTPAPGNGRFNFIIVGTLPVGTPCDPTQYADQFNAVPQSAVTSWDAPWNTGAKPTLVLGLCT